MSKTTIPTGGITADAIDGFRIGMSGGGLGTVTFKGYGLKA